MTPLSRALTAASVVIALDQLTKWWAVATLPGAPITLIDGILDLRYVTNSGASFSMFQGRGSLIALAVIAITVFIVALVRKVEAVPESIALGLVLGGALGNLLDRVFRGPGWFDGPVVDFFDLSFFPAFNVADSAVTIGAGLLLLIAFLRR